MDNEVIYDEQIAPLMEQIIAICQRSDIPLVACFEYATGKLVSTVLPSKESPPLVLLAMEWCVRAEAGNGAMNVDAWLIKLLAHSKQRGHSSLLLKILENAMAEAAS